MRLERSATVRVVAAITLLVHLAALALPSLADPRGVSANPIHIEAVDAMRPGTHHPASCALCALRHLNALLTPREARVPEPRPAPAARVRAYQDPPAPARTDPDPARAPPIPTARHTPSGLPRRA